ncbi:hypothetical protein JWG44_18985 [Leptospira sp. 201903071]|nr:hypothetical protein [Leptospira ainazelensis]MBM9502341.1 hypothetical protein [Leptospira ainazelensis]
MKEADEILKWEEDTSVLSAANRFAYNSEATFNPTFLELHQEKIRE